MPDHLYILTAKALVYVFLPHKAVPPDVWLHVGSTNRIEAMTFVRVA
jgi:hypothetical protein